MKSNNIIVGVLLAATSLTGCTDFLNQDPQDFVSEAVYFKTAAQFTAGANNFYNKAISWSSQDNSQIYDWMDYGTDISGFQNDYGRGIAQSVTADISWRNPYKYIRENNLLIEKAAEYTGAQSEIATPLATAYFFRAWQEFFLLKRFGGVPIVTRSLDVTYEELNAPRNSRYEVFAQILADLNKAIATGLPAESSIAVADKGHISLEAAKAFKARVLLYEGTWEKYVVNKTDGNGTSIGAGTVGYSAANSALYLAEAKSLAKEIIDGTTFQLFDHRDKLGNDNYFYLFNLEDASSNPGGYTKADNKEFIFYSVYDYTNRKGNANLTHTKPISPSRKMMDMYLCTDGLPIQYSPLFKGYQNMTDEFDNRDLRLTATVKRPLKQYWGWGLATDGGGAQYAKSFENSGLTFDYRFVPDLRTGGTNGYVGRKFTTESKNRETTQESFNYPQIRLAEIYLIYAEATCELNGGTITDGDLDYSINKVRARAGVSSLTNALIAPYSDLTLLGEIRRERALELFGEGQRFDDLKRWGIAEAELNHSVCGVVVIDMEYATALSPLDNKAIYLASGYKYQPLAVDEVVSSYAGIVPSKKGALVTDNKESRQFAIDDYLSPIPTDEINLNPNLKQNAGW